MRRTLLCLSLLFVAPTLRAQHTLPPQFGRWTASAPSGAYETTSADGSSPVFQEAGLTSTAQSEYSNGSTAIRLRLYTFQDSSGSYQAFTYLFKPTMVYRVGNSLVQIGRDRFFMAGDLLLVAEDGAKLNPEELEKLGQWLNEKASNIPPPPIPAFLPKAGRVPGSERYALGPVAFRAAASSLDRPDVAALADEAGFNSRAEAMFARYQGRSGDASLLLIEYPTPQLAEQHLRHLEQAVTANASQPNTSIERNASLLVVVLRSSSAAYAKQLTDSVDYGTQVTWNEPTHTITDPPITSTLAKIIVGTGVFMLIAVVLGVAFGGVRVITKLLLPGKVFDRPADLEVLQLGLSGKKIDPSDFY
jgi:uncharacterized protein DUF6599